jgi:hypothetical protein
MKGGIAMSKHDNMLNMIQEGMKVFDNSGDEVGTVEWVHFGEVKGAASPSTGPVSSDWDEIVGDAFSSDKLPKELRERLLMHGFVKMDSKKLFGADRYVMFDQIDRVEKNGVHLTVADSEGLLEG